MQKINWANGIEGGTPLSDTNLNLMEDYMEEGIESFVGDRYSSSDTYKIGDFCIYNDVLYKCITAVETAEDFDQSKWVATNINKELNEIENIKKLPDGDASLQSYWWSVPSGWYSYNYSESSISNMPENWGIVNVQETPNSDFSVVFYTQASGKIYRKSGNSAGITEWVMLFDNKPQLVRICNNISITTGDIALNSNINNYNLFICVTGAVGDGTLSSQIISPMWTNLAADGTFSGWRLNTKYDFAMSINNGLIKGYFKNTTTITIESNNSGRAIRCVYGLKTH